MPVREILVNPQKEIWIFKYTEKPVKAWKSHGHDIIRISEDSNIVPVNHLYAGDLNVNETLPESKDILAL